MDSSRALRASAAKHARGEAPSLREALWQWRSLADRGAPYRVLCPRGVHTGAQLAAFLAQLVFEASAVAKGAANPNVYAELRKGLRKILNWDAVRPTPRASYLAHVPQCEHARRVLAKHGRGSTTGTVWSELVVALPR